MSVNMMARKAESSVGLVFAEGGSWMRPRKASTADRSTAIIWLATCPWASAWTLSAVSLSGASTRQNVVRRSASYQYVRNFTPYLDFQVLYVQLGNFLRRSFDNIVTIQEDWHLLPPH